MLIAPVAYVDLTDIYRIPSRRHRVMTCLAGIYIELTIASIAIFCWWNSTSPTWIHFLVNTALTASVASILFNLNPLMRLDGYHAVCDWLDRPHLGSEGTKSLQSVASLLFLAKRNPQELVNVVLAAYGFSTLAYRFVISVCVVSATYAMCGQLAMAIVMVALLASAVPVFVKVLKTILRECKQRPAVAVRMSVVGICIGIIGATGFQVHRSF